MPRTQADCPDNHDENRSCRDSHNSNVFAVPSVMSRMSTCALVGAGRQRATELRNMFVDDAFDGNAACRRRDRDIVRSGNLDSLAISLW